MTALRVIELFSGVGSQRMAFNIVSKRTGIQFDYAAQCDIDEYAIQSYNAIHGDTPNLGDITKIEHLPPCDILTWSFPCQSVSLAGRKQGMKKDSGTSSSLAWDVIRLLQSSHRPEWLIMENVPAITYKENRAEFNRIIRNLSELGYRSIYKVLKATDFNVPQTRDRCFMVSRYHNPVHDFPKGNGLSCCLSDFLESSPDQSLYTPANQKMIVSIESDCLHIRTNNKRGWMLGYPGDGIVLGQSQARGVARFQVCPTINTKPGCGVITEDNRIRTLSPRECWRLMGLCPRKPNGEFDDTNFEKVNELLSNSQLYKQAGNSIVVDVLVSLYMSFLAPKNNSRQALIDSWGE